MTKIGVSMESLIDFLNRWQTLIGSIIGGVVGLLAASLVAYQQRRRDEDACATLLLGDLTIFREAVSVIIENQRESDTDKGRIIIAHRLVMLRPTISPMFDASMVRVISVDGKLAAHLHSFKMLYSGIMQILDRLALQFSKEDLSVLVDNVYIKADANKLAQGIGLSIKQAECATYFLKELFLRRCVSWIRLTLPIRRRFYPTAEDKRSETLLREVK